MGSANLSEELRARGLRLTPQRQLVLDAVHALGSSTPEQIAVRVRQSAPAVNITTVYRTLDLLERLGLVRHRHVGHGAPTYTAAGEEQVHTVCHRCGRVRAVSADLLDGVAARLWADEGFRLDAGHVALSGVCRDCANAANAANAANTD